MKKFLKQRKQGNIADIIGTSICLLALVIVFMSFVHFCTLIEYKRQLNEVARDYLLKIETTGTLTAQEVNDLQLAVNNLRPDPSKGTYVVTTTFNGTNTAARYGEDVSINIQVQASYDAMGLTKMYGFIKDEYVFEANYYSTSKQ